MLKLKQVQKPVVEPVSLASIKTQLKIDPTDDSFDEQLDELIPAAREWCETYQNRAYITQKFDLALNDFPCTRSIRLPRPPLQTIDGVAYVDVYGSPQTFTGFDADMFSEPGNLVRTTPWPRTNGAVNNVIVTYTAGYGDDPDEVPVTIRQAIILLVVHWFNNGLCDPPNAVYALLNLERVIPI